MTETAAPTAHDKMMDAHFSGDQAGAQALSGQVNREAGIDQPASNGVPDSGPGAYVPDPRIDEQAPKGEAAIVQRAATTLSELGPEGQALVEKWGGHTSQDFQENLSYAREAFRDIATNRPDLIQKVDASGLGNDPSILEFLAQHGRLQAGFYGDFTVARNGEAPRPGDVITRGSGSSAAQAEQAKLLRDNPPGSEKYRNPDVQRRMAELSRMIAGGGDIVGTGGRTA
jgi:hypothetical protein